MVHEERWGSFRTFLTWRDWASAFSGGALTTIYLFLFLSKREPMLGVIFLILLINTVREFVAFRRKLRIMMDFLEPEGA